MSFLLQPELPFSSLLLHRSHSSILKQAEHEKAIPVKHRKVGKLLVFKVEDAITLIERRFYVNHSYSISFHCQDESMIRQWGKAKGQDDRKRSESLENNVPMTNQIHPKWKQMISILTWNEKKWWKEFPLPATTTRVSTSPIFFNRWTPFLCDLNLLKAPSSAKSCNNTTMENKTQRNLIKTIKLHRALSCFANLECTILSS